jgi:hypothetical protein
VLLFSRVVFEPVVEFDFLSCSFLFACLLSFLLASFFACFLFCLFSFLLLFFFPSVSQLVDEELELIAVFNALEIVIERQPIQVFPVIFQHLNLCETTTERLLALEMLKVKVKVLVPKWENPKIEENLVARIQKVCGAREEKQLQLDFLLFSLLVFAFGILVICLFSCRLIVN